MARPENGLQLLAKGYGWLPDRRRALGRRTVTARLGGLPVTAIEGPDAARFLYDEDHVQRAHAIPEPVQGTLFGKGAVHTLDGDAHRVRKAMFVALLMREDGIASLVQRATTAWDDAVVEWARRPEIVLLEESAQVLAGAVTRWAGVPVSDDEVPALARDLQAMVDGFATGGPRHFRARRARGRREKWLARSVEEVRAGTATVEEGSAVDVVARHRDAGGELLEPRVAAVELLNVVRPTTAVSWFVAFTGHALIRWPENRKRLADGDLAYAEAFAHEVRRFYPFAPFIGGRAPREVEWDGERIPENSMVLLDLYGQNHDPELWGDPYAFRPDRFLGREIGAFDLVPQGGGDPRTGHRCPGEQITVSLLSALAVRLSRLEYDVPEQDLTIALHRIPARPAGGVRLKVWGTSS
ncbi:cytochrome P450 [Blastococcus sp. CT_GayMR20]|uniref:cytochrome P450 n=1 Tax=Blastococcus sp. CT_GayMR20 TaxID=2559609 RepID=UPI001074647D|nr:cytochrome P450 [Blastococcus sp. CT_GayMR20]TFV93752.1 cytochrome P450 [Blastococcus sp. CT_GayMR20]TFV93843.1 cytochrome P450 [Blastococcus sp. CT_GayMR20]